MASENFTDKKGHFKGSGTYKKKTIGWYTELMEWIWEHNNMPQEEKIKVLTMIEDNIEKHINEMGIGYTRKYTNLEKNQDTQAFKKKK